MQDYELEIIFHNKSNNELLALHTKHDYKSISKTLRCQEKNKQSKFIDQRRKIQITCNSFNSVFHVDIIISPNYR